MRLIGALMTMAVLLIWPPAHAQVPCGEHGAIVAALEARYGERRVSLALGARGALVETFANRETGSWTVTATEPGGPTCLIMTGTHWQGAAPAPNGRPS